MGPVCVDPKKLIRIIRTAENGIWCWCGTVFPVTDVATTMAADRDMVPEVIILPEQVPFPDTDHLLTSGTNHRFPVAVCGQDNVNTCSRAFTLRSCRKTIRLMRGVSIWKFVVTDSR